MTFEIIILAMIAAFLGLRLYSVLGKRTGHEQEPLSRRMENAPERPAEVPANSQSDRGAGEAQALGRPQPNVFRPGAEHGIREILSADRNFDVGRFMEGAKAAYGMILEAFWKGEREDLRELTDADVYAGFEGAIAGREERGETLDNRLVRIDEAIITDAEVDGRTARITVHFEADIAAVTRNSEGEVIAGSLSDAVQTNDLWTFSRDLSSNDPNWMLTATDEG